MTATSKVATFISFHVDRSGKRQREIADEAGFPKENVISMLKMGTTKVPLARVSRLARAIDVDPKKLFQLCIEEYMPELLPVLEEIYGQRMILSDNEIKILKKLRSLSKDSDPNLNGRNEPMLREFIKNSD